MRYAWGMSLASFHPAVSEWFESALGTPTEIQRRADDLFAWVAAGDLRVTIDREFPLAEARAAHDAIEGRRTKGKLLLRSDPR